MTQILRSNGTRASYYFGLLLIAAGCAGEGTYRVHLTFENDAARASVKQIELFAIERSKNSCEEWMQGQLSLANLNVYSRLVVELPPEVAHRLARVPARALLFLAEGRDGHGPDNARLLRGCTAADVRSGTTVEVTVKLEHFCTPLEGGEIIGNAKDDDCDGLIDECAVNGDCDDGNVCTLDLCENGVCHQTSYPDGVPCQDMDRCTRKDACVDGVCRGESKDCGLYSGQCRLGGCEERTGACVAQPVADGLLCDDGLFCTVEEACRSGDCVGTARACEDGDVCTADSCDEAQNRCGHERTPRPGMEGPPGTPSCANGLDDDCDGLTDGNDPGCNPCVEDQECDDDNPCTADVCEAEECKNRPVVDGSLCDNGRYCTVGDGCEAGVCLGAPRDCGTLSGICGVGVCDEVRDACVVEAKANGTSCDDGLFCTLADKCQGGVCRGIVNDCDDESFCTTEGCNETSDRCEYTFSARPGWEGSQTPGSCTNLVDDDCDGMTDAADANCVPCESDAACEDQNVCTEDRCAEGYCENQPVEDGTACDDGNPCTLGDGCEKGLCTAGSGRKDSDNDGYVDRQCALGVDCDDGRAEVNPGAAEGPFGDATCTDGLDNDCDDLTDGLDIACLQCAPEGSWCGANGLTCLSGVCVCSGNGGAPEEVEQSCDDGADNDCDGQRDCLDTDCPGRRCDQGAPTSFCTALNRCECAFGNLVDEVHGGRGSVVELEGRPRFLYNQESIGIPPYNAYYVECDSGCSTQSPVFSPPLQMGPANGEAALRPRLAVFRGSSLAALWGAGDGITRSLFYAECSGTCSALGSWEIIDLKGFFRAIGSPAGLAILGDLRAIAGELYTGTNGEAVYVECSLPSCADSGANWASASFPFDPRGGAIALTDLGGGQVRRSAIWGGQFLTAMIFGECTSGCTSAGNWTTVALDLGYYPDIVIDQAALPRVFFNPTDGLFPAVWMTRCTERPCTSQSNWSSTELVSRGGFVTAGVAGDGRTFFTTSSGGNLLLGVEAPTPTGYAISEVPDSDCRHVVWGQNPTGYPGPMDRWRLLYQDGSAMRFLREYP